MANTREHLHKLLEEVPEDRLQEAASALMLLSIPDVDEPLTEEELESIREGLAAYERGESFADDEVKLRMGS